MSPRVPGPLAIKKFILNFFDMIDFVRLNALIFPCFSVLHKFSTHFVRSIFVGFPLDATMPRFFLFSPFLVGGLGPIKAGFLSCGLLNAEITRSLGSKVCLNLFPDPASFLGRPLGLWMGRLGLEVRSIWENSEGEEEHFWTFPRGW